MSAPDPPNGRLAIFPGSFDPITNGHVDIILRSAHLFERILVAVLVNQEKKPLFTPDERIEIIREVFSDTPTSKWIPSTACWSTTRGGDARARSSAVSEPCRTTSTSSRWR